MPFRHRTARLLTFVAMAFVLLIGPFAAQATAHPLSTTAVLLDLDRQAVAVTVELPVDRLAVAFNQPFTATSIMRPATLALIRTYVRDHMSASDDTATVWTTSVGSGRVESIDGVDHLVLQASLVPAAGTVANFTFHYDAILDRIVSHRIFVSAREGHTGTYTTLAMLSWQSPSVPVRTVGSGVKTSSQNGFLASLSLGVQHIRTGSDHLLFLFMLLLPAPLAVRGRQWIRRDDLTRAGWRVVHVVSAFAVGHSTTLVLGAVGLIHLPTRVIESGIALSVLVSATHAIRPLVRGGEMLIAGGFGLLHGLAFAALIDQLGLGRGGLIVDLLGFNLGIEVAQLLVVALVMPSLFVLSRTGSYGLVRTALGALGAVLAAAWLVERIGLLSHNPLEPVSDTLVNHPLLIAATLATGAGLARLFTRSARAHDPDRYRPQLARGHSGTPIAGIGPGRPRERGR